MTPRKPSLHRLRRWIAICCVAIWIGAFVATHVPSKRMPEIHVSDKSLHAVGYCILAALLLIALALHGIRRTRRTLLAAATMIVYATLDESTQPLVNRNASIGDWLADLAGVVLALVVLVWAPTLVRALRRRLSKRKQELVDSSG